MRNFVSIQVPPLYPYKSVQPLNDVPTTVPVSSPLDCMPEWLSEAITDVFWVAVEATLNFYLDSTYLSLRGSYTTENSARFDTRLSTFTFDFPGLIGLAKPMAKRSRTIRF